MISTAIILGLTGSLHCLFMCSPLAAAVTGNDKFLLKRILYNGGRILTYAILGMVIASVGSVLDLSGLQAGLTIVIALMLVLVGVTGIGGIKIPMVTKFLLALSTFIKNAFGFFLKKRTHSSVFVLGLINGLLPCGISFLALTYCVTLVGPLDGFKFMLWFGVGTLPAMLGLTSMITVGIRKFNLNGSTAGRYSYIALGLILVARLFFVSPHEFGNTLNHGLIILCQ